MCRGDADVDGFRKISILITVVSFYSGQYIIRTRQMLPGLVQPWWGYVL